MLRTIVAAAFFLTLCGAGAAWADAAAQWRALTRADVEAAHRLLREDHPAASRTLNDSEFRAALESAYRLARQRAREVEDYDGYVAVMAGFANAMGDRHIWSRPLYSADRLNWTGLVTARRGDRFVVAIDERGEEEASLVGATLVSCDGVAADDFAAAKLGGFRAVWAIEAQRVQSAPLLLVDDGNPFVMKPAACMFERDGAQTEIALNWRAIARTELATRTRASRNIGAAGYGVRDFTGGAWIALERLGDEAQAVVEAVRADAERLRAAPVVVLDLRGNGGGNSQYGREIAEVLFGEARAAELEGGGDAEEASCEPVWRASPRNIAQLRAYLVQFAHIPDFLEFVRAQLAAAEQAAAQGREFGGAVACGEDAAPASPAEPSPQGPRVVLLTDAACFSSCLLVADDFRRLGALHVGTATNANTHFSEVREERMPSGLSMFSTLQALMPAAPRTLGPYEPALRYDGDMRDTAALEAWVAEVAARP